MNISFAGLQKRFREDRTEVKRIVHEVGRSGEFILKRRVEELESQIRGIVGTNHCIAAGNGTQALFLILSSLGLTPSDEVLTPAFSFISSASTIVLAGGTPRFVDVDLDTATVSVKSAKDKICKRVKALIAVHLFRSLADMQGLRELCSSKNIKLIEDSAVSLGARFDQAWAGTLGDAGVFSFYPVKPLGGIGEAGVVVTNDESIARHCKMMRNHGQDGKTRFLHHMIGYNHRMDEISAAYLLTKLERRERILTRREQIGKLYDQAFAGLAPAVHIIRSPHPGRLNYNYAIRVTDRRSFQRFMAKRGVETCAFYGTPLPFQPAFENLGCKRGEFPNAERLARESVCIPMYPELTDREVQQIAQLVRVYAGAEDEGQVMRNF